MWRLLKFLPRRGLSRLTGWIVNLPGPWAYPMILVFSFIYRIKLSEAERPVMAYPSLGEFFVRRLKPGARPLAKATAVHCADARIIQSGEILEGGWVVQAKGITYQIRDFLVDPTWKDRFANGYFVTYYLCPTDYHRVHSPVAGLVRKVTHVPGDLWPVHDSAVASIPGLYNVNERVIVEIVSDVGAVAVVFVGAMNVGSIRLSFDQEIRGNSDQPFTERTYEGMKEIGKGQELGMFRMGSTVVVFFSEEFKKKYDQKLNLGPLVKVNSALTNDVESARKPIPED